MSRIQTLDTPLGPAALKRSDRRTLAISVLPDGSLELVAPANADERAILAKVSKRTAWIRRQRRAFQSMNVTPPPRRYVTGATHRYLGRQYRLKITMGGPVQVRLKGGYFHITTPNRDPDAVKALLDQWFRERAIEQFTRRLAAWEPWCQRHHLPIPRLSLRKMSKRWGSAATNGRIALNPELIHAPSQCIEYVVAHEICHLKHPSHDPAFFRQLSQHVPNWNVLKQRLESTEMS